MTVFDIDDADADTDDDVDVADADVAGADVGAGRWFGEIDDAMRAFTTGGG